MSPFAAKRLYNLFGNVIRDYEKRYGVPDVETRRPETASVQQMFDQRGPGCTVNPSHEPPCLAH